MKTAITILTWNRVGKLKETVETFRSFNKNAYDDHTIVVNNGSDDGTREYVDSMPLTSIHLDSNLGAQKGKMTCWQEAKKRGYDYILFLEDDFPSLRDCPIAVFENFLAEREDIGYIRLNDKKYRPNHVISKKKVTYSNWFWFEGEKIRTSDYNFTTNPIMFRTSLVDHFVPYGNAKHEKDYMRWYMDKYKLQAQVKPFIFKTVIEPRQEGWIR